MKKLVIVLGMLISIFGTTMGVNATSSETGMMSKDEAKQVAESLVSQINEIVVSDQVGEYSSYNPELADVFASWESGLQEIGEYQGIEDIESEIKADSVTITGTAIGSEKNGEITISLDAQGGMSISLEVKKSFGELMKNAGLNTILGVGTTFIVLVLIMFVIYQFEYIQKWQTKATKKKETKEEVVDQTIAQIVENEELSDDLELVAVIAAAIAASQGVASTDGFVVRSIKRANTNKWKNA